MEGFDEFWTPYPRKDAKKAAQKAWIATRKVRPSTKVMIAAVAAQGLAARERCYIPLAATWINGHRWEDESGKVGAVRDLSTLLREEEAWMRENGVVANVH